MDRLFSRVSPRRAARVGAALACALVAALAGCSSSTARANDPAAGLKAIVENGIEIKINPPSGSVSSGDDATASEGVDAAYELFAGIARRHETGPVDVQSYGFTVGELNAAVERFSTDPDLDLYAGCSYSYFNETDSLDSCPLTQVTFTYYLSGDELAASDERLNAALDEAVATIEAQVDLTDEEQVARAVHDYLATVCTFETSDMSATAYGALVYGAASNRGYADAFYLIAERLGLSVQILRDVEGGTWDMVQVDGAWYHVDVCWDDKEGDPENTRIAYLYFLVDDDTMRAAHNAWEGMPEAPRCWVETVYGEGDEARRAFALSYLTEMFTNFETTRTDVDLWRLTSSDVDAAVTELADDPSYPYAGYNTSYYNAASGVEGEGIVYNLTVSYRVSDIAPADYWSALNAAVDQLVGEASGLGSDYEKILYVHDQLVRRCAYGDTESDLDHLAYAALVNGRAVCEGYTAAYRIVLNRLGIQCIKVESEEMNHSWNMVYLDGAWYHVDVCWDDPTPDQGPDAWVSHDNFLKSDWDMQNTGHYNWSAPYEAPSSYPLW